MINARALIPGERHHWWPSSLSQYWKNDRGLICRIDTSGAITMSTPKRTARIADGHNIRIAGSPWDSTFEQYFDQPDGTFPRLISWLESLATNHPSDQPAFVTHQCGDDDLGSLGECLVSLVLRSPMFREQILKTIKHVRSNVSKEELRTLIAANLGQSYSQLIRLDLGRRQVSSSHCGVRRVHLR